MVSTMEVDMDVLLMPGWAVVSHQRIEAPGTVATRLLVVAATEIVAPEVCPKCACSRMVVSGQRAYRAVDAPLYGDRVQLTVMQPRFRCEAAPSGRRCGHVVLQPLPDEMKKGSRFTARCAELIHREQATFRPVTQISKALGVGESSVRGHISRNREAHPVVDLPVPRYLGIDEIHLRDLGDEDDPFNNKKRAVFVDLEAGQIIALLEDNNLQTVGVELARLAAAARAEGRSIRGVAADFHRPYRTAVKEQLGKKVPVVIDRFHVEHRLHRALNAVRVRELKDHGVARPAFLKDRVQMFTDMLRSKRTPSRTNKRSLFNQYLAHYPETAAAYEAKQSFKVMWGQRCSSGQALANFRAWRETIPPSIKKDFDTFGNFIEDHRVEVFAYFDLGISNSQGESRNRRIRDVMRTGKRLYLSTLRGKLLDHAQLAYQAPRTHFCCDGCGDRTSEYAGKVGPDPHPLDAAEMWLCPTCKADPLHSSPRPSRRPTPRRRRSVPDLPQAEMMLLGPAEPATMGPGGAP